ncbi:ExeM/NucH family extracellular endonuclease [Egicoccus sp. AB-alg2]|uniref:ExeM/NucH family extracellular endonuclease n=1 Tax=Egicoccus sp. AB-alg2 TaxID=3242693 RepID=UPI00359DA042
MRRISLLALLAMLASALPMASVGAMAQEAEPTGGAVVISQVYGGGGNSGATYTHDFVELLNRTSEPVDVTGWAVGYASSSGTNWNATSLSGTIAPGGYLLVQQAPGSGGTTPLPTPDVTGGANMSATAGKVALATSAAALQGGCPTDVVDLVGFGSANCFEGSGPTPTLNNTTAAIRAGSGCTDSDDNAADFATGAPAPRNSASPTVDCGDVPPPPPPPATPSDDCDAPEYIGDINTVGDNGLPSANWVGQRVAVEAVVTADFKAGLNGFYVQEEDVDADDDATTSEGIFVFAPAIPAGSIPEVGTLVCVVGFVGSFQGQYQLTNVEVETVAYDVDLPTAVALEMPVDDLVELSALSGMRVELTGEDGTMTVAQNYFQGQYGELDLSATGRLWNPSEVLDPRSEDAFRLRAENRRSLIKLDDANSSTNRRPVPWLANGATRAGAETSDVIEGIASYQFGAYRIQPTAPGDITFTNTDNPRPDGPPDVLAAAATDAETVTVAAFNVLNYFTTLTSESSSARGADTPEEFELQAAKIVTAITKMDADVVGLMEIENNFGADNDALLDLVDRLNAVAGDDTYAAVALDAPSGTDAISNAMIYQPASVTPVGEFAQADHPAFVNPLGAAIDRNRPAITQAFATTTGEEFIAVVNHLKSKGSACGAADPADPLQGNCNLTRTLAAQELVRWLSEDDPTGTGSDRIAIMGDLNAYAMEDPIQVLRDAGYVDTLADQTGSTYSYVFDGELGRLDHAFVSSTLSEFVVDAAAWHINTDEPAALDYNNYNDPATQDTSEFRSSDHDPLLFGLAFPVDAPTSPQAKDQCKNDGWRRFSDPSFRNQGECVAWVAAEGRNLR